MKKLYTYILVSSMVLFSCKPDCTRDGGSMGNAECNTSKTLYVLNSTAKNIQLDNIRIKPGQKIILEIIDHGLGVEDFPTVYFSNDTAFMIFNESVIFRHVLLRTDSGFVYIPSEHNILDADSWQTGYNGDSWSSWAVYTFNDEDCQRALEMTTI
ncbi:MAG: hypothetical protein IKY22_00305 [Bacteroidales bacterium]|nr:hypothetical protein [Bacteroidales bacterium]